jgi:hypothetical protein
LIVGISLTTPPFFISNKGENKMTEDDGTNKPTLDENGNPIEPGNNNPPDGGANDEPKFSKVQLEQISTIMGRIVKKQIEEDVIPKLKREEPVNSYVPPVQQEDAVKKFNEQLQEKIFAGDVLGALQLAGQVQENAKQNLTKTKQTQTEKALISYSEKPFYKDIYSDMKTIALDAVNQGYPPEAAGEYAYHKAKADYLEKGLNRDDGEGSLDMVGGGRSAPRTKKAALPQHMKDAAARDIQQGLYKDESEWIKALHPSIRKQYAI